MSCKCEYCDCSHSGTYGSGRFCNAKCARGFSTKSKRASINEKVSKKLSGSGNSSLEKTCPSCDKTFSVPWNKRNQKSCSRSCGSRMLRSNHDYIEKLSKARIKAIKDGKTNHYGTKCEYEFRDSIIKCDSKIEYACLNYFETVMGASDMRRCDEVIEYLDGDIVRRYLPDFLIRVGAVEYIVECKSYASSSLNSKWRKYNELAELKKVVLADYAKRTDRVSFWFTAKLHRKYYSNLKF